MIASRVHDFLYGDERYYRREWKEVMEELKRVMTIKDFIHQLELAIEVELWMEEQDEDDDDDEED